MTPPAPRPAPAAILLKPDFYGILLKPRLYGVGLKPWLYSIGLKPWYYGILLIMCLSGIVSTAQAGARMAMPAAESTAGSSSSLESDLSLDIPILVASDDLSAFTTGAAWDLSLSYYPSVPRQRSRGEDILLRDALVHFQSTGTLLLDPDLNRHPLTAALRLDIGWERMPTPPDDIPTDIMIDDVMDDSDHGSGLRSLRYHYRMALLLEAATEAEQSFDAAYFTTGAGLRLLNLSRTGWSGWLPSLRVMYEGVFRINQEAIPLSGSPADSVPESDTDADPGSRNDLLADDIRNIHHRLRLVYRHQLGLAAVGLSGFTLAGGLQYTRDFGQTTAYTDAGLDSRFGWVTDLSYALRWDGREGPNRIDLFVRFAEGRIAPLATSDRSFTLGFRIPYSQ